MALMDKSAPRVERSLVGGEVFTGRRHASLLARCRCLSLLPPLSLLLILMLAACQHTSGEGPTSEGEGRLRERDAIATGTACACGCFPYGSHDNGPPFRMPSPTGTWVPPTSTPTPSPTRPGGPLHTVVPPTATPAWHIPGAVTCTPAPWQPTITPPPTPDPFDRVPDTPLPSGGIGNTPPQPLGSMASAAGIGQPALDPRTGMAVLAWSQAQTESEPAALHRVYVRSMLAGSGQLGDALGVNLVRERPAFKQAYSDSAVAVTADGVLHILYCEVEGSSGAHSVLGYYRQSGEGGLLWSDPMPIGESSPTWCNNLRLKAAPDGSLYAIWTGGNPRTEVPDSFVRVARRLPDGRWERVNPPRTGEGAGHRQFEADVAFVPLYGEAYPEGSYRTVMIYDDGADVWTVWSDPGDDGAWRGPTRIVSHEERNGALHLQDYIPAHLRLLSFPYDGRAYLYGLWNIYSTGRICFVYSSQADAPGGPRFSEEDSFAAFPPSYAPGDPPPPPDPEGTPVESGGGAGGMDPISDAAATPQPKVHMPEPVWVEARQRVFVAYRYCDPPQPYERGRGIKTRDCYAAFAFGLPSAPGNAWEGRVGSDYPYPLRAFRSTVSEAMGEMRSTGTLDSWGNFWLVWGERTAQASSSTEVYYAALRPYTLISDGNQP
jgi:hypothetical protein